MLRTRLVVSFWHEGLPEVDWWRTWLALARLVEKEVAPSSKGEVIWWTLAPSLAIDPKHIVIGGSVELCREFSLPAAACATFYRNPNFLEHREFPSLSKCILSSAPQMKP